MFHSQIFFFLGRFGLALLSSQQIGKFFSRLKFPLISGYLIAGMAMGPYFFGILSAENTYSLRFIDDIALAFIAFAAGSEIHPKDLKRRFNSIKWLTLMQALIIFFLCGMSLLYISDWVPFMRPLDFEKKLAISLLAGTILLARSPSSAIAVIKEFRAKGPFTQTALGVTIVMDVVVIVLFAVCVSISDALLTGLEFNLSFIGLLLFEFFLVFLIGYFLCFCLKQAVALKRVSGFFKTSLILLLGYGIFLFSTEIRYLSHQYGPFEIFLEPLLICMIGSFLFTHYSSYGNEFLRLLNQSAPFIYLCFFTLTGASITLDILAKLWPITALFFLLRLIGIFIGSFLGGLIAKDPMIYNKVGWMAYVTQAGVGLGLAKEVASKFPEWGDEFATLIISVIIVNQLVGPAFFKWALFLTKEGRPHAKKSEYGIRHHAVIFGADGQSVTLARQLRLHHWQVQILCRRDKTLTHFVSSDPDIYPILDFSWERLKQFGLQEAGVVVCMLPNDEENYKICQWVAEHFPTMNAIVLLNDRVYFDRFQALGTFIVAPSTAIISLLDHFVRNPSAVSLLLGQEKDQKILDLEVRNPDLVDLSLRELHLPEGVLILSIHRGLHSLHAHGSVQFQLGDLVTIVGSPESLEALSLRFEG